jgi:predicted HicB family RNase H-like nuclease
MQTQTPVNASHYSYRVTWSAEDDEFVATCLELPSLSWLAPTQIEAIQGLVAMVTDVLADLTEQGEQIPLPFAERTYSGTFNVRIGEGLHRDLVVHAAEVGLSLNQYVVKKLSSA